MQEKFQIVGYFLENIFDDGDLILKWFSFLSSDWLLLSKIGRKFEHFSNGFDVVFALRKSAAFLFTLTHFRPIAKMSPISLKCVLGFKSLRLYCNTCTICLGFQWWTLFHRFFQLFVNIVVFWSAIFLKANCITFMQANINCTLCQYHYPFRWEWMAKT